MPITHWRFSPFPSILILTTGEALPRSHPRTAPFPHSIVDLKDIDFASSFCISVCLWYSWCSSTTVVIYTRPVFFIMNRHLPTCKTVHFYRLSRETACAGHFGSCISKGYWSSSHSVALTNVLRMLTTDHATIAFKWAEFRWQRIWFNEFLCNVVHGNDISRSWMNIWSLTELPSAQ